MDSDGEDEAVDDACGCVESRSSLSPAAVLKRRYVGELKEDPSLERVSRNSVRGCGEMEREKACCGGGRKRKCSGYDCYDSYNTHHFESQPEVAYNGHIKIRDFKERDIDYENSSARLYCSGSGCSVCGGSACGGCGGCDAGCHGCSGGGCGSGCGRGYSSGCSDGKKIPTHKDRWKDPCKPCGTWKRPCKRSPRENFEF